MANLIDERFHTVFRFSSAGMSMTYPDGRFFEVNEAFCRFLGYSADQLMQLSSEEITHPDDRESGRAEMKRLVSTDSTGYQMEKRYIHGDGHEVWVAVSVSCVRDEQERPLYLIAERRTRLD